MVLIEILLYDNFMVKPKNKILNIVVAIILFQILFNVLGISFPYVLMLWLTIGEDLPVFYYISYFICVFGFLIFKNSALIFLYKINQKMFKISMFNMFFRLIRYRRSFCKSLIISAFLTDLLLVLILVILSKNFINSIKIYYLFTYGGLVGSSAILVLFFMDKSIQQFRTLKNNLYMMTITLLSLISIIINLLMFVTLIQLICSFLILMMYK